MKILPFSKKEKPNKKGVIVFGDIFLLRSRKTDAILLLLLWGWYNNKELQKVKTFLILRNIVQHIGWKSPFDVRRGQMSNYTNTRKDFWWAFLLSQFLFTDDFDGCEERQSEKSIVFQGASPPPSCFSLLTLDNNSTNQKLIWKRNTSKIKVAFIY